MKISHILTCQREKEISEKSTIQWPSTATFHFLEGTIDRKTKISSS